MSLRRRGRLADAAWDGRSSSCPCKAMLSANSSFIATNCLERILPASLAPIGGSADDRITAPMAEPVGSRRGSALAALGWAETNAEAAAAESEVASGPGVKVASPARADGGR